jgi:hypothetical protein
MAGRGASVKATRPALHPQALVGFTIFAMVAGFTLLFVVYFVLGCCCCPPMYGHSPSRTNLIYLFILALIFDLIIY